MLRPESRLIPQLLRADPRLVNYYPHIVWDYVPITHTKQQFIVIIHELQARL